MVVLVGKERVLELLIIRLLDRPLNRPLDRPLDRPCSWFGDWYPTYWYPFELPPNPHFRQRAAFICTITIYYQYYSIYFITIINGQPSIIFTIIINLLLFTTTRFSISIPISRDDTKYSAPRLMRRVKVLLVARPF